MIQYNKKTKEITRPQARVAIRNKTTGSKYLTGDLRVVLHNGVEYLHPIYSTKIPPIQYFEIDNWEKFKEKQNSSVTITERNNVSLSQLKITHDTDTFNILLITYLKHISNERIITTNPKRLKNIIAILKKSPHVPLPWKYVDEILEFAKSNKESFFNFLMKDEGRNLFNKFIKL